MQFSRRQLFLLVAMTAMVTELPSVLYFTFGRAGEGGV